MTGVLWRNMPHEYYQKMAALNCSERYLCFSRHGKQVFRLLLKKVVFIRHSVTHGFLGHAGTIYLRIR